MSQASQLVLGHSGRDSFSSELSKYKDNENPELPLLCFPVQRGDCLRVKPIEGNTHAKSGKEEIFQKASFKSPNSLPEVYQYYRLIHCLFALV